MDYTYEQQLAIRRKHVIRNLKANVQKFGMHHEVLQINCNNDSN